MKLSILIPTTPDRRHFIQRLSDIINNQLGDPSKVLDKDSEIGLTFEHWFYNTVDVIILEDPKVLTIGTKRNLLLKHSSSLYTDFIDSDDRISDKYFKCILEGIVDDEVDCCSLKGVITEDGNNPLVFEHSIKYNEYKTNPDSMPVRYERYPNHLNCIKSSIAKQFKFPEKNHGEDTDWATQIFKSGLVKTEHYIDEVIYYYDYRSNK